METMYAKSFGETIHTLKERRKNLDTEIKELYCNVAKAFMEKYNTNQIQFDLDDEYYPTFSMAQMDDNNADVEVRKIIFDEKGEIRWVDGYNYYDDEDVYDVSFDNFYDIDYLDLVGYINEQLEYEQYIEED